MPLIYNPKIHRTHAVPFVPISFSRQISGAYSATRGASGFTSATLVGAGSVCHGAPTTAGAISAITCKRVCKLETGP